MASKTTTAVLTHAQKVVRMYRRGLKSMRDFSEDYDCFLINARDMKNLVTSRANETNPFLIQQYIKEFETKLDYWTHPDPYIPCDNEGGSKWQRNIPPPSWVNIKFLVLLL
eukprot:gene5076-6318_t